MIHLLSKRTLRKANRDARRRKKKLKYGALEGRPLLLAPAWEMLDALEAYEREPTRPIHVTKMPKPPNLGSFGDDDNPFD